MASIYLHIPYCEKKCIYCDFYSIENMNSMEKFLTSLHQEITLRSKTLFLPLSFETIFFGGGTPSLLSPSTIEKILNTLHKQYHILPNAEITVETNPGTVNKEKLKDFRSLGINRLSIGIQSFYPDELQFLGRIHSAEEAKQCVSDAYNSGFENLNVDLIFSLPNQTPERWENNLQQAIELHPKHISAYSLIVEEQTPLFSMVKNGVVTPLPEDIDAAMYETTIETLSNAGYNQYEISNYAKDGYDCQHNNNYWNHSDYISFGPSAHSFLKKNPQEGKRWWNVRSIQQYCEMLEKEKFPLGGEEEITTEKFLDEEIFLGLRSKGIDIQKISSLYGINILSFCEDIIAKYQQKEMLVIENNYLRLTPKGYMMCDSVVEEFLNFVYVK